MDETLTQLIFWRGHLTQAIIDEDFDAVADKIEELMETLENEFTTIRFWDKNLNQEKIVILIAIDNYNPAKPTIPHLKEADVLKLLRPVLPYIFREIQPISAIIQTHPNVYPAHELIIHIYPKSMYQTALEKMLK